MNYLLPNLSYVVLNPLYSGFDHFLDSWAEICQIFRWFFGKLKNIKKTFFKSVKTGRQFKALIQINQSEFRCMVCETTISSKSELQPHFIERRHERYGQNYKEVAILWVSPRTTKLDIVVPGQSWTS